MKRLATLTAATAIAGASALASAPASAAPFAVCPDQEDPNWQWRGYTVDQQTWGNWFVAAIPWDDTPANMSGTYAVKEDFLFQVDPSTCGFGASQCFSTYNVPWFTHRNADCSAPVYGLGEFFDAGIVNPNVRDGQFSFDLDLSAGTWAVFYDFNRDGAYNGGLDHDILEGTVVCYANVNGNLYAVLEDDDGAYDGMINRWSRWDEGTPDVLNGTFHLGSGQYPSSLINAAFASGDEDLFDDAFDALVDQGLLSESAAEALQECGDDDHDDDDDDDDDD